MLTNLHANRPCLATDSEMDRFAKRNQRNEAEDMPEAVALLYEFKAKLDKLHPNCAHVIEHMLQRPKHY